MKFATKAIHIGEEPNYDGTGEVVSPIHLSTTFARRDPEKPTGGYEYTRTGNPTREALEGKLASIENAKFGLAFSSGLSAETTLLLSTLKSGDMILASDDLYGGTRRIFDKVLSGFGIRYRMTDLSDPAKLKFREKERVVWVETPSNPLMKVLDLRSLSKRCRENDVMLVVDNTFASPYFQNPLDLGADIVIHSTTKYINGHSDSLGGSVMLNDESLYGKVKFNQNAVGAVLSPFDSFLTLRGVKTLEVRMERHERNAREIASFLEGNDKVSQVLYPGLETNPYYAIAKRQMRGFSGMLSFYVKGNYEKVKRFLRQLKYFSLAESLGGVESLVEVPYFMTHASVPETERRKNGITKNLVRMSVGIENIDDLVGDIENALKSI
ncbi:MAG: trans-sulfuration enzyme family protein [Thermoplasmata archaeon]